MAKWTLANNALQDKELLDHLKGELSRRPKVIKEQLTEVVEAAETFETAKIRKEASGAIEELKRKGPESLRKFGFWSQAGQTVLALGCVAAGALGHVEIAVPCVIGGAATSAGLKIFGPQPYVADAPIAGWRCFALVAAAAGSARPRLQVSDDEATP